MQQPPKKIEVVFASAESAENFAQKMRESTFHMGVTVENENKLWIVRALQQPKIAKFKRTNRTV